MTDPVATQAATSGLTSEAWATLVAAFIGAIAALIVVAIQRFLDRCDRIREENSQRRAITTALLCEMDLLYREHVRRVANFYAQRAREGREGDEELAVYPVGTDRLAVYKGNAGSLGHLPPPLIMRIIEWYGSIQSYLAMILEYSQRRGVAIQTETQSDIQRALGMEPQIRDGCQKLANLTCMTCGLMCGYIGMEFSSKNAAVFDDPTVSEEIRTDLANELVKWRRAGISLAR